MQLSKFLLVGAFSFLGLHAFGNSTLATTFEERLVPIADVRPTQMEVGMAHVEYSRAKIYKNPNLVESVASRVLPAWIGPDNKVYITDGHHWASGSQRVLNEHPSLAGDLKIRVQLEADYSQKTWENFYVDLYKAGKGYFSPQVRSRFVETDGGGKQTISSPNIVKMYSEFLPKNLNELRNNPWRSVFGMALEEIGFDPNFDFIDYIEFYLAEEFAEHMRTVDNIFRAIDLGEQVTETHVEKIELEIAKNPPILDFILNHLRPEAEPIALRNKVFAAVNKFRAKVELPSLEIQANETSHLLKCISALHLNKTY
jgi:hypothetical protein